MKAEEVYAILNGKIRKLQITGGGVTSYNDLDDKPQINGETLVGAKTLEQIGISEITNTEIEEIIKNIGGL